MNSLNFKKFSIAVLMSSMLVANGFANSKPPQNTLDLTQVVTNNGAVSPALQSRMAVGTGQLSSPYDYVSPELQAYIQPSPQVTTQQAVNEYIAQQLTPSQVQDLRRMVEGREKILSVPYTRLPKPVKRSLAVNLAPDASLPIIRLAKNMQTTIAFTDEDGTAWQVEKISLNNELFTNHTAGGQGGAGGVANGYGFANGVNGYGGNTAGGQGMAGGGFAGAGMAGGQSDGLTLNEYGQLSASGGSAPTANYNQNGQSGGGQSAYNGQSGAGMGVGNNANANGMTAGSPPRPNNIISIEPNTMFGYSNMVVTLKGKTIPLVFLLTTGEDEVDMLVMAHIGGINPDRERNLFGNHRISLDTEIDNGVLQFLDGRTPVEAIPLISSNHSVQGWEYNNQLFVKTRYDVLYPAYTAKASLHGYHVYRFKDIGKVKQITLTQERGQPLNVTFQQQPYYLTH